MTAAHVAARTLVCCAALALQACAQQAAPMSSPAPSPAPRQPGTACNAQAAQFAVGQQPLPSVVETARRQAGATSVRVIGHDEMVTKEYLPTRLNLQLDAQGKVTRVYCG